MKFAISIIYIQFASHQVRPLECICRQQTVRCTIAVQLAMRKE